MQPVFAIKLTENNSTDFKHYGYLSMFEIDFCIDKYMLLTPKRSYIVDSDVFNDWFDFKEVGMSIEYTNLIDFGASLEEMTFKEITPKESNEDLWNSFIYDLFFENPRSTEPSVLEATSKVNPYDIKM